MKPGDVVVGAFPGADTMKIQAAVVRARRPQPEAPGSSLESKMPAGRVGDAKGNLAGVIRANFPERRFGTVGLIVDGQDRNFASVGEV